MTMHARSMERFLNQALRLLEDAKTHIEDNCDSGMGEWLQNADALITNSEANHNAVQSLAAPICSPNYYESRNRQIQ